MAKFYQHLLPGENLGKVTQLKYIDDVSDDDLILYRFTDGTACSKDFIASPDNLDAADGKFVMVELYNAMSQWKLHENQITLGNTQTARAANGEEYDIPVPGIQQDGTYAGKAKDGSIRIIAEPPAYFGSKKIESDENYILSTHPELMGSVKKPYGVVTKPETICNKIQENKKDEQISESFCHVEGTVTEPDFSIQSAASTVDGEVISTNEKNLYIKTEIPTVTIKSPDVYICEEYMSNIDKIHVSYNDNTYTFDKEEFFKIIENSRNPVQVIEEKINIQTPSEARNKDVQVIEDYLNSEDVLITNMIEKSKKVDSEIGMDITLALPPKSVYNTIKDVYPDDMSFNFIKSLAYRIPIQHLIDAIANGLLAFYDSNAVIKNEDE